MKELKQPWKSNALLQVFLSLCSGRLTQRELSGDTGFTQPVIYDFLKQLKIMGLVKEGNPKKVQQRKDVKTYVPIYMPVVKMNLFPSDPQLVFNWELYDDEEKELLDFLIKKCERFLYLVSNEPQWRNEHYFKWFPPKIERIKSSISNEERRKIINDLKEFGRQKPERRNWINRAIKYVKRKTITLVSGERALLNHFKKNPKFERFTFEDVTRTFLEYLTLNKDLFTVKEQQFIDEYVGFYFRSIEGMSTLDERLYDRK